jgi:hypothetical protein
MHFFLGHTVGMKTNPTKDRHCMQNKVTGTNYKQVVPSKSEWL